MKFKKNFAKIKKISKKIKKIKEKLSNLLDNEDKKTLRKFIVETSFIGIICNYSLWVIFGLPFTFYSWIGYGFAIYLIQTKLIKWLRSIRFK